MTFCLVASFRFCHSDPGVGGAVLAGAHLSSPEGRAHAMLRNRLLPVARLVSPFVIVGLLLPATVAAQEALPIGPVAAPEAPLPQPVPG